MVDNPPQASSGNERLSIFDRFATVTSKWASRAGFFVFCVVLVMTWVPSILVLPSVDTWQLVINTATTIITFLLVALLQNTQSRSDAAIQQKLNAMADALADFMGELSREYPELDRHRTELADAVGLEKREGSR
ncbi:low affinity iron permease family protein [Nocardia sp. CA-129566]|uniref:low affinity iron permease family protein n=1 Tax=Nocardia sp. CA-129566 TaxID=3239976 RepID=UPI003D969D34